ncbi:MAG: energy transducer TonB [Pyrinomonadaceae bacterium]
MRTLFSICLGVLLSIAAFIPGVSAQDIQSKVINAGVVNGKATSLPKPVYPETAKKAGIGGSVAVDILIDEAGNVIFAQADLFEQRVRRSVEGTVAMEAVEVDLSLREAAEAAAREAKFAPTMLNGEPVRVKGKMVYSFVADGDAVAGLKGINGGVLNGKATALPKPVYPAAARAVGAQGTVSVQILINEEGNIESAAAISGHPLLRAAAEAAARGATFLPTQLSGKPVRVQGILTYNFVLPVKADQ